MEAKAEIRRVKNPENWSKMLKNWLKIIESVKKCISELVQ